MENLYNALKSIGLSDEYIDFIRKNISDNIILNTIVSEIESDKISDINSFMEFFNENFRLIPNISMFSEVSQRDFQDNRTSESKTVSCGMKIINAAAEAIAEESRRIISERESGISIVTVKNDDLSSEISNQEENEEKVKPPLSDSEVIQHTASLWKYQPINEGEPEIHDEYQVKKLELSEAVISGASVRGKKHKHDGSNRDDWFEIASSGDVAVMAVSDGAGSRKFSRIGAEVACVSSVNEAVRLVDKLRTDGEFEKCIENISSDIGSAEFHQGCMTFANIVQDSVICAYDAVQKAFEERRGRFDYLKILERDMDIRDFSSTLLLVIAVPVIIDGKSQTFTISCQIGDGMIAAVDSSKKYDEAVKLLGEADGGSFAGETDFLTSESMRHKEKLMSRTRITRRRISDILIMTDGVSDDYYPNSSQIARLYTDLRLNGIAEINSELSADNNEVPSDIPEPVSYPWVNDNSVQIPLNYSSKIISECGISAEVLWENNSLIKHICEKLKTDNSGKEEKLKVWLDNYVERGSFDDRTLVIYSVCNRNGDAGK